MTKLSIVIPSRLEGPIPGVLFLEKAIGSIRAQAPGLPAELQILVGVDADAPIPPGLGERLGVRFIESEGRSQAAALNAAMRFVEGDHVAFLEDDDQWNQGFLDAALKVLRDYDFVSSTQLEIGLDGEILRINDFPTPSGWIMRRAIFDAVGSFDPEYQLHLDNDWLGRLGRTSARRVHFVEATAPLDIRLATQVRPWLASLMRGGRPSVVLARHGSPWPFVVRVCHPDSGMQRIIRSPALRERSLEEVARLKESYGDVPW